MTEINWNTALDGAFDPPAPANLKPPPSLPTSDELLALEDERLAQAPSPAAEPDEARRAAATARAATAMPLRTTVGAVLAEIKLLRGEVGELTRLVVELHVAVTTKGDE